MYLGNQQARPVGYAKKKYGRAPSRKTLRLVDDDRLRPLAAGVHHHPREGVQLRHRYQRVARPAAAISIASRWRTSANPLMVGFYVLSMLVVGSHLWHGISSAFQSLGARPSALDAAHPAARQGPGGR